MGITKFLKNIEGLKKAVNFSRHFVKRHPEFYFFSVSLARKRACWPGLFSKQTALTEALKSAGQSEMVVSENLLAIPLRDGKTRDYSGGLVGQVSRDLIAEAIHLRCLDNVTAFSQELPPEKINGLDFNSLPEIKHVVLYGGLLYNHFGHFLLESLGRLWAYEKVKHLDPYIFFLLAYDEPEYLEPQNFAYQVFKGFGIPLRRILFVKQPTRIKMGIIPLQKYGYGFTRRPSEEFLRFVERFAYQKRVPSGYETAKNIYVSRSRLKPGSGKAVGENFFEEYLSRNGYHIFYPERHTLSEQLSVYSQASRLLFNDGSAIHTCILLPRLKAKIAVIARRKDEKWDITEILDQFKGYRQYAVWIDAVLSQYQFGLESWQCIALIDWVEVSRKLKKEGFVDGLMEAVSRQELDLALRTDMQQHLAAISKEPLFINYMLDEKQKVLFEKDDENVIKV